MNLTHLLPTSSLFRVIKERVCSFKSYNFTINAKLVELGVWVCVEGGRGGAARLFKKRKEKNPEVLGWTNL